MAKKSITVCDRCPDGEDVLSVDTVTFATADGSYQADLCDKHLVDYQKFEEELAAWTKSARLVTPAGASTSRPRRRRTSSPTTTNIPPVSTSPAENTAIRAWCRTQGIEISQRGRIPEELRQRWRDRQAQDANNRWAGGESPAPSTSPATEPAAATG